MNTRQRTACILVIVLHATLAGCGDNTAQHKPEALKRQVESAAKKTSESATGVEADRTDDRGDIHFVSMRDGSGITFRHTSGNSPEKAFPAANGSGLAAFDSDMDGHIDLYFGNGTEFPINKNRTGPFDQFYRNLGAWKFRDATQAAGFRNPDYTTGVECGDYNNDGFPDLYLTSVGKNQLYCNLGDGSFEEVSEASGTADASWGTSAAFLDVDQDGWLDLYVCNYGEWTYEKNRFCGDQARGIRMFCSPTMVPSEHDVLYRSLGDGTFENFSQTAGISLRNGRGQGVLAADLNEDHTTDLYVSNDINPNFLFLNDGHGHFEEVGELSGAAYDHLGQAQAGMGLAIGDVDRNGCFDLFVTNYQNEHNALYENLGNGVFLETGTTRVPEGSLPFVGWGTALEDFDLDGWLDLIVTNGHTDDNLAELGKEGVYLQPPGLWKNTAGRLKLVSRGAGSYFRGLHNGRGLVTADLDNDGDSDVVIGHQDNFPELLRNDSLESPAARILQIRLIDAAHNRDAIGAIVEAGGVHPPLRTAIHGGGSYASASDKRVYIAIGGQDLTAIQITWPNGTQSIVADLTVGSGYAILHSDKSDSQPRVIPVENP